MKIKHILRIASFFLTVCLMFTVLSYACNVQVVSGAIRLRGFNCEDKNTLDVVFIGASDMFTSFSSNVAWEKYGFTSYVYGIDALNVYMLKPAVKYVLERQSPKLLVIELNPIIYNEENCTVDEQRLHALLDHFLPTSRAKYETLKELVPDSSIVPYYLTLLNNHNNWKNPGDCYCSLRDGIKLHLNGTSYLKGYRSSGNVDIKDSYGAKKLKKDSSTAKLCEPAEKYLRDLLDYLKANNIDNVLFYRAPHKVSRSDYETFQRVNTAGNIVQEYGYSFLNCDKLHTELGIDTRADFYNMGHLNVYGQIKVTTYLGKYLCDNYGLDKCEHTPEVTEQWDRINAKAMPAIELCKHKTDEKNNAYLYEGAFDFNKIG